MIKKADQPLKLMQITVYMQSINKKTMASVTNKRPMLFKMQS